MALPTPKFTKSVVENNRIDGYWLETFWVDKADKYPGLIGYGIETGDLYIFDNPKNKDPEAVVDTEWPKYLIHHFSTLIAVVPADCAGNGRFDIIACYDMGPSFLDCKPDGGHVIWLENPGRNADQTVKTNWTDRYIGRWPAMHRLKAGYFTQKFMLEVVAMPVVHGPGDIGTPIPIILFQRPEKSLQAIEWNRSIVDDENFTLIHDAVVKKFEDQNGRDSLFVASREGINWLYWEKGQLKKKHIHAGMPKQPGKNYWGSSCVDVGKVGDDPVGYIATIDPFNGNTVTVLTKDKTGLSAGKWIRHVLDVYGTPEQLQVLGGTTAPKPDPTKEYEGPGHFVVTGDFDNDGDDEFLVALYGPAPYQGVYYYKPIDLENGVFAKWKVAEESAARIAIGHFKGGKSLDFASIVYNVSGQYQSPDPKIHLYTSNFVTGTAKLEPEAIVTVWDTEPLIYVPYPTTIKTPQTVPLMELAGYKLDLEILPPNYGPVPTPKDAIKVLYGELWTGTHARRALNVPVFEKRSAVLKSGSMATKAEGVIFLRFTSTMEPSERNWKTAAEVPVKDCFKFSYPQLELPAALRFIKVEDLPWGGGFKGRDFYNMTGIYFRFMDKTELCHVQFWTAGKNVNCGMHNHNDCTFLEVHLCLSPGTGNGGMVHVKPGVEIPEDPEDVPPEDLITLSLGTTEQHGGFWARDSYDRPLFRVNGTANYPYHKWQGGNTGDSIDVWTAIEYNSGLKL